MIKLPHNWKQIFFTGIVLLAIGVGVGWFFGTKRAQTEAKKLTDQIFSEIKPVRQTSGSYQYIGPILTYDVPEATEFGRFTNLEKKLNDLIGSKKNSGDAETISVYYRSFNTGNWIGLNQDENYTPASLFKVPVMMAYYHLAEKQLGLLQTQLKFTQTNSISRETIQGSEKLIPGQTYTVDELIRRMIVYSDNDALTLLLGNIEEDELTNIFSDLGIKLPQTGGTGDFISVKTYANFFRILYGSTYLSRDFSEKALHILTQAEFRDGLAAGEPSTMPVAHKFGEYALVANGQITDREFHDCGVVYYPDHPYLLCVMTKGQDLGKLEHAVQDVSKTVYGVVDNAFHK